MFVYQKISSVSLLVLCLTACGTSTHDEDSDLNAKKKQEKSEGYTLPKFTSEDFCVTDFSLSKNFSLVALTCKTKEQLQLVLDTTSIYFGVMAYTCSFVPVPTTQLIGKAFAGAGIATGVVKLSISAIKCEEEKPQTLDLNSRRAVTREFCRLAGRQYVAELGPNKEPGCR